MDRIRTSKMHRTLVPLMPGGEAGKSTTGEVMEKDPFTGKFISCAIEAHQELGPCLLHSAYKQCLAHKLKTRKKK